jgi:hypothetical protein
VSLEHGFGKGSVCDDGAQDRVHSTGQLLYIEGAYLAGDLPVIGFGIAGASEGIEPRTGRGISKDRRDTPFPVGAL